MINEIYAKNTIEEVSKEISELSQLKPNLENHFIKIVDDPFKRYFARYLFLEKGFMFSNDFKRDGFLFRGIAGHEVMHNAQFSNFPKLHPRITEFSKSNKNKAFTANPFTKLIEGDATLLEIGLYEKYFDSKISSINLEKPFFPFYLSWANTLKEKFNCDREKINQLYLSPVGELEEVFESK